MTDVGLSDLQIGRTLEHSTAAAIEEKRLEKERTRSEVRTRSGHKKVTHRSIRGRPLQLVDDVGLGRRLCHLSHLARE